VSISPRERLLSVVLGVVVVAFGGRAILRLASGGELGLVRDRTAVSVGEDVEVVALQMSALDRHTRKLRVGRDPFRFAEARRPQPARPPRRQPPPPVVEAPPSGPQPPPIRFRYLGSFGRPDHKVAVFADDETIYNAMVGEILDGKFKVREIGFESVEMEFVDFPDLPPRRLPVGG